MKLSFLCVAATIVSATLASLAQAQTSYPLICQPGSGMTAILEPTGTESMRVRVAFRPGTQGGGFPDAGECRWGDRAFRDGEPTQILIETGSTSNSRFVCDHTNCALYTDDQDLDHVASGIRNESLFGVYVYSDGNFMIVTGFF